MTARGAAAAFCAMVTLGCGAGGPAPLPHSTPSSEALAQAVLQALERRDVESLRRLAMTEEEFREHVWPALPASRPERNLPFSYVWGDLRQKSDARLATSLARHGGRAFTLVRVEHAGETTRYPDALVHREAVLTVRAADGSEHRLRLYGSTLERGGGFKVFSYLADD